MAIRDDNYVCCICEHFCEVIEIDEGIGCHEYGSIQANHIELMLVSECCEGEYVDCIDAFELYGDAHLQEVLFTGSENK